MKFRFPSSQILFEQIKGVANLQKLIQEELRSQNLHSFCSYKISNKHPKYIYCRCRFCSAEMRFKLQKSTDSPIFRLTKFSSAHNHAETKVRTHAIQSAIRDLPDQLSLSDARRLLQPRFGISNSSFYRLWNRAKNPGLKFTDLLNSFNDSGHIGYFQPRNLKGQELPQTLIMTTLLMKDLFKRFGELCTFDFTYNMIREKSIRGENYRVGMFVGLSNACKIVPFAFVLTDNQTKENLANIFHQFFGLMGGEPEVIISDQQKSIQGALQLLQYEGLWRGLHLLDSYHILQNAKKKLQNKNDIYLLSKLIHAKNKGQYEEIVEECKKIFGDDNSFLNEFLSTSHRYSFANAQPFFIGFCINSSMGQKTNDLVKDSLTYSKTYTIAIQIIIKKLQSLASKCEEAKYESQKFQGILGIQQLERIRKIICKKVFRQLLLQISKSLLCMVEQNNQEGLIVYDKFSKQFIEKTEDDHFSCSCKYLTKCGIPCQHLLRILFLKELKIQPYISKRWRIEFQLKADRPKKSNPQRKTKRNTKR